MFERAQTLRGPCAATLGGQTMARPRIVLSGQSPKLQGLKWESDRMLRIGRQHSMDIVLDDLSVCRHHADVVTAGSSAYAALSNNAVAAIDLTTNTIAWSLALTGQVVDVAANSANTLLAAAAAGGATSQFYLINPATHLATDSIPLAATPVRMVMTSTGTRAFVDENSFQLEIIDIATRSVVSQISLPGTVTAMKMVIRRGPSLGVDSRAANPARKPT